MLDDVDAEAVVVVFFAVVVEVVFDGNCLVPLFVKSLLFSSAYDRRDTVISWLVDTQLG